MGFFDWFFGDLFTSNEQAQASADYTSNAGGWYEPDYRASNSDYGLRLGRDFDPSQDDDFTRGTW